MSSRTAKPGKRKVVRACVEMEDFKTDRGLSRKNNWRILSNLDRELFEFLVSLGMLKGKMKSDRSRDEDEVQEAPRIKSLTGEKSEPRACNAGSNPAPRYSTCSSGNICLHPLEPTKPYESCTSQASKNCCSRIEMIDF